MSVLLAHRLQLARIVTEIEHPAGEAWAGLDRAARVISPQDVAVACVKRVDRAVLGAEEELAFVEQWGGLCAAGQVARPTEVAVERVQSHDPSCLRSGRAREHGCVHGVAGDSWRGG